MSQASIVLDTNLLVLFVVGTASRAYIPRHKRLKAYAVADFELLLKILAPAPEVLLTPNTLTETSNLVGNIAEPARTHVYEVLKAVIRQGPEKYISSRLAAERPEFLRLGLTDAALLSPPFQEAALLTADLHLYLAAVACGRPAFNFNHFRHV